MTEEYPDSATDASALSYYLNRLRRESSNNTGIPMEESFPFESAKAFCKVHFELLRILLLSLPSLSTDVEVNQFCNLAQEYLDARTIIRSMNKRLKSMAAVKKNLTEGCVIAFIFTKDLFLDVPSHHCFPCCVFVFIRIGRMETNRQKQADARSVFSLFENEDSLCGSRCRELACK